VNKNVLSISVVDVGKRNTCKIKFRVHFREASWCTLLCCLRIRCFCSLLVEIWVSRKFLARMGLLVHFKLVTVK
jgi:hypothetical protein